MSGVEVLEAMRTEPCLAATPVIMISAATELETVVRRIELGAEDYLPKPFNPVLLRARLGTVPELAAKDILVPPPPYATCNSPKYASRIAGSRRSSAADPDSTTMPVCST
jgi:DNA-binding response OmpR family regulator